MRIKFCQSLVSQVSGFGIFLIGFFISCSQIDSSKQEEKTLLNDSSSSVTKSEEKWKTGAVFKGSNFSWFIPSGLNIEDSIPCILFFDPQGNGSKPIEMYMELAQNQEFILVGSDLSKNGMNLDETRFVANQLLSETQNVSGFKRLSFYLSGFSGGAKVAFDAANENSIVKGIIYSGAPAAGSVPAIPIFGFSGDMDINLADIVQFNQSLNGIRFLKIWKGKHVWPESKIMASAFEWIKIRENSTSGRLEKRFQHLIFQSRRTNDLLAKESLLKEAEFLANDLKRNDLAVEELSILEKRPAFKAEKEKFQMELGEELKLKEFYGQAFFEKDLAWWKSETDDLRAHKKYSSPDLQDRLLGYFSLVAYSLSNRSMQQNDLATAEKILEIYRLADPENFEQAYLKAVLFGKKQQAETVLSALSEAIGLGFNDKARIAKQQEFQFLIGNSGFGSLLASIKE